MAARSAAIHAVGGVALPRKTTRLAVTSRGWGTRRPRRSSTGCARRARRRLAPGTTATAHPKPVRRHLPAGARRGPHHPSRSSRRSSRNRRLSHHASHRNHSRRPSHSNGHHSSNSHHNRRDSTPAPAIRRVTTPSRARTREAGHRCRLARRTDGRHTVRHRAVCKRAVFRRRARSTARPPVTVVPTARPTGSSRPGRRRAA